MNEKGLTTITLKKINRGKVYQYIYRERVTSKQQIVQDLQMGLSTVSQNLNLLEQEGLVERNGNFDSTGGRKAQAIRIVADARISIGVGILKQMLQLAAVDLYGEAIRTSTFPIPYSNTEAYYSQVSQLIQSFIEEGNYDPDRILGVSIATQGIVSPDGAAVTYGKIMGNSEMKLSDFSSRLPFPCRLEHDSKAAASLELWNHRELESAVVLLLNQNLGGAVIANRSVLRGMSMHSGTIEHMCMDPDGPLCYCGSRGCLEAYCSANALEAASGMAARDFFPLLREGQNQTLQSVWEDYLAQLAFAIRNLNMVMDSPVIISGYLAPYFTEEDLSRLSEAIDGSMPFSFTREHLLTGIHGQYAPVIGAALFYVEEFIRSV